MNKHCVKCGVLRPISRFQVGNRELQSCDSCRATLKRWRNNPTVKARTKRRQKAREAARIHVELPYGKKCSICKSFLPKEQFPPDKRSTSGLASECYECNRARTRAANKRWRENRKKRGLDWRFNVWGVTIAEYNEMLENQNGRCAICGLLESSLSSTGRRAKALAVDHNHETGAIRELLCDLCNRSVGMLREKPELAEKLAAYLKKHTENPSGKIIPFKKVAPTVTRNNVAAEANWTNV